MSPLVPVQLEEVNCVWEAIWKWLCSEVGQFDFDPEYIKDQRALGRSFFLWNRMPWSFLREMSHCVFSRPLSLERENRAGATTTSRRGSLEGAGHPGPEGRPSSKVQSSGPWLQQEESWAEEGRRGFHVPCLQNSRQAPHSLLRFPPFRFPPSRTTHEGLEL